MLRATDENGNVLPEFEKVLDIDIKLPPRLRLERTDAESSVRGL